MSWHGGLGPPSTNPSELRSYHKWRLSHGSAIVAQDEGSAPQPVRRPRLPALARLTGGGIVHRPTSTNAVAELGPVRREVPGRVTLAAMRAGRIVGVARRVIPEPQESNPHPPHGIGSYAGETRRDR
jgi:hypothetical protein